MLGEELRLVAAAPHDLVMLDGTFTLPVIYFNQAFAKARQSPHLRCSRQLIEQGQEYLRAYVAILRAERSDKHFVGLPKYSTRREIGRRMDWPDHYDDRGMLTLLLKPGELTTPQPFEHPRNSAGEPTWHLNVPGFPDDEARHARALADRALAELQSLRGVLLQASAVAAGVAGRGGRERLFQRPPAGHGGTGDQAPDGDRLDAGAVSDLPRRPHRQGLGSSASRFSPSDHAAGRGSV